VDSTLKRRVITALIIAPVAIGAVFFLNNVYFALLFWVVSAAALYEWFSMLSSSGLRRWIGVTLYAGGALVLYLNAAFQLPMLAVGVAFWFLALLTLGLHRRGFNPFRSDLMLSVTGLVMGWAAWLGVVLIQAVPDGQWWILWVFGIAWGADIGAYFAGKRFGKTKLAPSISPGKTWEGVAGGILLAGLLCGGPVFVWQTNGWLWLVLTGVLIGLSVCGDLFESFVKRQTGVKDSGHLLPGHGGVLDRIDSILIVLPILALLLFGFRLGSV
jgi:phosphatidate cytidylyltransferase